MLGHFYFQSSMKREFTGAFIPAHIWVSKELIPAEKMLLGEIDALSKLRGYCDASRAHFAEWLNVTPQGVTYYFEKLERLGFITIEKTPGKRNKIKLSNERFYTEQGVSGTDGRGKPDLRVGVSGTDWRGKPDLPEIKEEIKDEIKDKDRGVPPFAPASAQSGNSTVEEKEKTPLTPSSAAPRSPKKEKAFDDKDVARLLSGKEQVFFAEILKNETWPKWLEYKKKKFKFEYDAADSAARIIRRLYSLSGANPETAAEIAGESRSNGWKGFFPIDKPNAPAPFQKPQYAQPMSEMAGLIIRK